MEPRYDMKIIKNEHRKADRMPVSLRVQYKPLHQRRAALDTMTQDVSGSGMRIRTDNRLHKGEYLKSLLYFPGATKPITAVDRVVWHKKVDATDGKAYFDIGIEHTKIDPDCRERFIFLVCDLLINHFMTKTQHV